MNVALIQLNLKFIDYYMTQIIYDSYRVTRVSIDIFCCVISITKMSKSLCRNLLSFAIQIQIEHLNIWIFFSFSMCQNLVAI